MATLQYTNSVGGAKARWLGIDEGHHTISHEPDSNEDAVGKLTRINAWYAERVANLVRKLKNTPEPTGDGTLLDHTTVVWTNEMGTGNSHSLEDIPWVVLGGGAGLQDRPGPAHGQRPTQPPAAESRPVVWRRGRDVRPARPVRRRRAERPDGLAEAPGAGRFCYDRRMHDATGPATTAPNTMASVDPPVPPSRPADVAPKPTVVDGVRWYYPKQSYPGAETALRADRPRQPPVERDFRGDVRDLAAQAVNFMGTDHPSPPPVRLTDPETGEVWVLVQERPPDEDPDLDLPTDEEYRRMQIEIDGGEISEVEALRRAIAFNESEAAARPGSDDRGRVLARDRARLPGTARDRRGATAVTVRKARSFDRDFRVAYRSKQEGESAAAAEDWAWAARQAVDELVATAPGFVTGYALAHEDDRLPGGPYRVKMFGAGKKPKYRLVFRLRSENEIELVALRHLARDDLSPLDL